MVAFHTVVSYLLVVAGSSSSRTPCVRRGFVGAVFVLAWALFRADFLDVVPVGRTRAVESMDESDVTRGTETQLELPTSTDESTPSEIDSIGTVDSTSHTGETTSDQSVSSN